MSEQTHDTVVIRQFGPQAAAYVTSAVHAQGEDLDQLARIACEHRGERGLDLGCGGGHVSFHVAPHLAEVVAYDLSPEMLEAVAETAAERGLRNIVTRAGRAEALPFDDGSFDLVFSRYSAHHWSDFEAGLREARRVLRPGGYAAFADVAAPADAAGDTFLQTIELLRDPSHVRNRSAAEWTAMLRAAGFVPARPTTRRLRLDFSAWIARMRTPQPHVDAIRSLQSLTSVDLKRAFELEPDGTFTIDTITIEATPA
jgi:ubiquinone/menaquinone biosynthesis C-methylase UbiE